MKNKAGADSNQKPGGIPRPEMRRETHEEALRRLIEDCHRNGKKGGSIA